MNTKRYERKKAYWEYKELKSRELSNLQANLRETKKRRDKIQFELSLLKNYPSINPIRRRQQASIISSNEPILEELCRKFELELIKEEQLILEIEIAWKQERLEELRESELELGPETNELDKERQDSIETETEKEIKRSEE